jgi:hypothetical protein
MPSKLDLVLIAASIAALVGFIERAHSIVIDPPESVEVLWQPPANSCREDDVNERVRFSSYNEGFIGVLPPDRSDPACGGD